MRYWPDWFMTNWTARLRGLTAEVELREWRRHHRRSGRS